MVKSNAATVEQYLRQLPADRRDVVAAVREVVLAHLPLGYQESMNWGMISYEVPLDRYPHTYNGQPLMYAALAAQKRDYSLYLMMMYGEDQGWLKKEFESAGKELDMGKSCLHFRRVEDLPLHLIGEVIASVPVEEHIMRYEASRKRVR